MNYLFFDLEEASSNRNHFHICEFGYVITNEKYEVLEQNNFIINPMIDRSEWDWYALRKILTRKIFVYENSRCFDYYYPRIVKLIKEANYIFGHTTAGDVVALNQEFQRNKHNPIDFHFYDIAALYKQLQIEQGSDSKTISLEKMIKQLNIEDGPNAYHDAKFDAYNTMLCMKKIQAKTGKTMNEIINDYPTFSDETNDFIVMSVKKREEELEKKHDKILKIDDGTNSLLGSNGRNKSYYSIYLENMKPSNNELGKFKGKKVSISKNYELNHFHQALNLIRLISKEGGQVILKASDADIVVKYKLKHEDGAEQYDSRAESALKANEMGAHIEIIELDELLNRLGITEQELDAMEFPSFDFMYEDGCVIKDSNIKNEVERKKKKIIKEEPDQPTDDTKTTLGDILGDVFDKLLEDSHE